MKDMKTFCDQVRQTAYDIHVYHGHLEKVYENALAHRLRKAGLDVKQQHPINVYDEDGTLIGESTGGLGNYSGRGAAGKRCGVIHHGRARLHRALTRFRWRKPRLNVSPYRGDMNSYKFFCLRLWRAKALCLGRGKSRRKIRGPA